MNDKKQLLEKQLNYITSNFEVDLLRLIKTRSYIAMSKEVINDELDSLKQLSLNFQENLKEIVMETLQLEGEFDNSAIGGTKTHETFRKLKNNLNDYIASTESFVKDLESRNSSSIEKLESLQKFYLMELEASREELDFRIKSLQGNMTKMLDGEEVVVKDYKEEISKKHDEIEKQIESKVSKRTTQKNGEFESVLNAASSGIINDNDLNSDISATTEIRKYRKNKREKWQRIFGIVFLSGILSICITLFYFYNKDYKKLQLAEESYKQSKVVEPEAGIGEPPQAENEDQIPDNEVSPIIDIPENIDSSEISDEANNKIKDEAVETSKNEAPANSVEEKLPDENLKKFTLNGKAANVRSGPSTRYGVVTVVKRGDIFESLDENSRHWIKIKLADQKEGWISGRLIKEVPQ